MNNWIAEGVASDVNNFNPGSIIHVAQMLKVSGIKKTVQGNSELLKELNQVRHLWLAVKILQKTVKISDWTFIGKSDHFGIHS